MKITVSTNLIPTDQTCYKLLISVVTIKPDWTYTEKQTTVVFGELHVTFGLCDPLNCENVLENVLLLNFTWWVDEKALNLILHHPT